LLQGAEASSAQSLESLASQRKALATQAAAVLAQLDSHGSSNGDTAQGIAAAQAQAASLQASIAARAQWAAELEQKRQLLQQQDLQCLQLQQRAAQRQQEATGLSASLAAVRSTTDAAAALQRQAQEASMHARAAAATVQQQQEVVVCKQQEVQQADSKAHSLLQQWQALAAPIPAQSSHNTATVAQLSASTAADVDCAVTAAVAAAATASVAADTHLRQLQGLQQQHVRLQMQVQAAEAPLTPPVIGSLLAALGDSSRALPLHACFTLKDAASLGMEAQQWERLLLPLSVIAGPSVMQTLVAPTVAEANRLLAAAAAGAGSSRGAAGSRRLKIWPLDNLTVQDMQRQQRVAQQQLGSHAVTLPVDLLEAEAAYRPALLRAFGGFVIAADDDTAAALVERFGLSAVTLQVGVALSPYKPTPGLSINFIPRPSLIPIACSRVLLVQHIRTACVPNS
jgi:chromosome segregation ATPase